MSSIRAAAGLGESGGAIIPRLKYDARAGRFFLVDNEADREGNFQSHDTPLAEGWIGAFDLAATEWGWAAFVKGSNPSIHVVPMSAPFPRQDKPDRDHKMYVRLSVIGKAMGKSAKREFGTNASCVQDAIWELWNTFCDSPQGRAGKIPLVKWVSVKRVESGQSTNYAPVFEVVDWIDRIVDLMGERKNGLPPYSVATTAATGTAAAGGTGVAGAAHGAAHAPPPGQPQQTTAEAIKDEIPF